MTSRIGQIVKTKRGTYIKRQVIYIQASQELTQQGNPDGYWYVLECGHYQHHHHCAKTVITGFQVAMHNQGQSLPYPLVGCHECVQGKVAATWYLKAVLERLPISAFKTVPKLQAFWGQVKDLEKPF